MTANNLPDQDPITRVHEQFGPGSGFTPGRSGATSKVDALREDPTGPAPKKRSPARKRRGAETQKVVAEYLRDHGWPYATDAGAGRSGSDILGVPGLGVEVKARRDFSPLAWVRQADNGSGVPMVVHRPDGMGPATVEQWPVTLRLADLVTLLRAAGYGDPEVSDGPVTAG